MTSKTIILSKPSPDASRGILTLYIEDDLLKCKIRLYNHPKLSPNVKLGIYHQDDVFSANLLEKNGIYVSSLVGNFDITKDFYCAIIDTEKDNEVLLSGGTYSGYFMSLDNKFGELEKENEQVSNTDDNCLGDCNHCKYKEFFFNQSKSSIEETSQVKIDKTEETNNSSTEVEHKLSSFAISSLEKEIMPHFEYIFEHYPIDEKLTSLIPNGKFVKMKEGDSEYYIGTIGENTIDYICYAKKCNYNDPVPEELGKYYQWLPIDKLDPLSDGYYLVFQDAKDLKILEI